MLLEIWSSRESKGKKKWKVRKIRVGNVKEVTKNEESGSMGSEG